MSTEICVENYTFKGQVYSPAFSEPSSPSSIYSDFEEDMDSLSPMSTCSDFNCDESQNNQQKSTSTTSMKRSNSDGELTRFRSKVPKYANKYEEMLQPLSPVTTLPCTIIQPRLSNRPNSDQLIKLQNEFESVIVSDEIDKVEDFLSKHSTDININQYNCEGRTALQQSCVDGKIELAKSLVKYGADHCLTNRDGFSTLQIAVFSGHPEMMMYILSLSSHRHS